ncbi:glycosyltransferase family 2 protein [Amylibacter sp. SFDW26]|uniref:glycosyltransferase family 2 protein n=1 Tax=Amylibacter sp. SFDW26 TaxID=2652722 RepID=UPI0012626B9D|nr:glycosyltransferase [Amylibacter sp. SFDW26]KAB7613635.1 glycosyltransferase family 2 protein [Amylibacter sp. SFDW26]
MSISVVVSILNAPALTANFLSRLAELRANEEFEVVLVCDGDQNIGTQQVIGTYHGSLKPTVVVNEETLGYGAANNRGVEAATGDVLVFMNTDVFPEETAITKLAKTLNDNADIGIVQALLIYPQNGKVQSCGHIFGPFFNRHALMGRPSSSQIVQRPSDRQALTSAFYAMRSSDFQRLGGFDTIYLNSHEGMELSLRVHLDGMRCFYNPTCRGFHVQGSSRQHMSIDERQQLAIFWSRWHDKIQRDLDDLLALQLTERLRTQHYLVINSSTNLLWQSSLDALGVQTEIIAETALRGHSLVLQDTLVPDIKKARRPMLFLTDHFSHISKNLVWFSERPEQEDLVFDCHGNVIRIRELLQNLP